MIFWGSKLGQSMSTDLYLYFNLREYLRKCNFRPIRRFFPTGFMYMILFIYYYYSIRIIYMCTWTKCSSKDGKNANTNVDRNLGSPPDFVLAHECQCRTYDVSGIQYIESSLWCFTTKLRTVCWNCAPHQDQIHGVGTTLWGTSQVDGLKQTTLNQFPTALALT